MSYTNILGTISAATAVVMTLMTQILGCAVNAGGETVCGASWLPPQYAAYAVIFFSGVALLAKSVRPGGVLRGLFGSTAVVVPTGEGAPGVVTTAQVASTK